jgi:hypothetical protein
VVVSMAKWIKPSKGEKLALGKNLLDHDVFPLLPFGMAGGRGPRPTFDDDGC